MTQNRDFFNFSANIPIQCALIVSFDAFFSSFVLFFYHVSCVVDQLKRGAASYAAPTRENAPPVLVGSFRFYRHFVKKLRYTALFLSYDFHFLTFELQQYWIINILPVINFLELIYFA